MKPKPAFGTIVMLMAVTWLFFCGTAISQDGTRPYIGHVFFGQMHIENDSPDVDGGDYKFNIFGADAQKPINSGKFRYGLETGVLFSVDSDLRHFSASSGSGGGSASVSIEINSFLIDYFFGGYLAVEPAKWLRLYAGAGPLLIWASRKTEPKDPVPDPYAYESESGLGAGVYARAGLDIFLTDNFGLNAGVRINKTTLSFEDPTGKVDVEGWQYYAGAVVFF